MHCWHCNCCWSCSYSLSWHWHWQVYCNCDYVRRYCILPRMTLTLQPRPLRRPIFVMLVGAPCRASRRSCGAGGRGRRGGSARTNAHQHLRKKLQIECVAHFMDRPNTSRRQRKLRRKATSGFNTSDVGILPFLQPMPDRPLQHDANL